MTKQKSALTTVSISEKHTEMLNRIMNNTTLNRSKIVELVLNKISSEDEEKLIAQLNEIGLGK